MSDFPAFMTVLSHTSRALTTAFDNYLKSSGVTAARGRVLLYLLRRSDGTNQADVTKFLRVEHPTAVRILDGMEAQGLIKRLPSEHDRRAKLIVLTEHGNKMSKDIAAASEVFVERVAAGLDLSDVEAGTRFLAAVLANIEKLSSQTDDEPENSAS
nr:MarR family winged helix-turn-helix transcriptional regulator [uncultured Devosia sp.]